MKRNTALLSIWTLVLPVSAQAEDPVSPLALRLAQPETGSLSGQQIRDAISNREVKIDDKFEPAPGFRLRVRYGGGCPPAETFSADGRWQKYECSIQSVVYQGHWTIEPFRNGHWLCVEAADYPKECRFVWPGAKPDQIIMALGTRVGAKRDDWYSPYRLTEWSGRMWGPQPLPVPIESILPSMTTLPEDQEGNSTAP